MAIRPVQELATEKLQIDLTGPSGNAFALLGLATRYSRDLGYDIQAQQDLLDDMKSGDYENLIQVFDSHFGEYVDLYR